MTIPEEWLKHIQSWQDSGLIQKDYCREYNLNYNAFVYWRGRIKQSKKSMSSLAKSKQVLPAFSSISSQIPTSSAKVDNKYSCIELSLSHGMMLKITLPC